MEITITEELKKLDSELITYLITIPNINNTITINEKYIDVFKIIKKGKTIYVDFKDVKKCNHIVNGLSYFGNKKIFENIMIKLAKYVKEKYIDRKSVERFFEKSIENTFVKTKLNWESLSKNPNLSESFFDKYIDKVIWSSLCLNTNISENFFEKYIDKVDWNRLCQNNNISEKFFEKYISTSRERVIVWNSLCQNTNLSECFFEKYIQKGLVNLDILTQNKNISLLFLKKYSSDNYNIDNYYYCCQNKKIDEKNIDKYVSNKEINLYYLSRNTNIDETFFEKYIGKGRLSWHYLCVNSNISEKFFEKHIKYVEWYNLCHNINLSESFFEKHIDKVIWSSLCLNTNMTEAFFENYISNCNEEVIIWENLSKNSNMSEAFFEKYNFKTSIDDLAKNTFRVYHKKEKIISHLKKNPQYSFDKLIYKYI